jgi:hypothetical protein
MNITCYEFYLPSFSKLGILTANTTDQELISFLFKGNQDALGTLYKRPWIDLYKFVFFILRDRDLAKILFRMFE